MRKHLTILASLLKAQGLTQKAVADRLGYDSASAVGMMLRGERLVGREELMRMCELAGVTLVQLASMSDDLRIARTAEAAEGAAILDELTPEQRLAAIAMLRAMAPLKSDR